MYMYGIFILLGLIMGSFLGVVIDRLPRSESISKGRSRCDSCHRKLNITELIPLISFIIQGAKCRVCKIKLSFRYPIFELLTAGAYLLCYFRFGFSINTLFAIVFSSLCIVITFIDIDTMLIYDRFHFFILMLALVEAIAFKKDFFHLLIASLIVSVPLYIIAIVSGGMGAGDIKLMFVSGFLLGITKILVSFVIAVIVGGIYGFAMLYNKKLHREDAIPFGPFLCLGLFVALLYGIEISNWYLSLLK